MLPAIDLLKYIMDNKKSGLALLAEQMPAVKAYKQVAWNINQIKKKCENLPGCDVISQCTTCLQEDYGKNFMKKWSIQLLPYERPFCHDRYFAMTSIPDKHADKKPEILHFLIGSTQPNLNILLDIDLAAHRACWLYYDALKETAFRHAMDTILQLFLEKKIAHLNLHPVHHRISVPQVRSFFKKQNYTIEIEEPPVVEPMPAIQQPQERGDHG